MVHSVGGTLMKHLEEHQIQGNRGKEDVLMYYTTIGWMMWNWMVTALSLGIFDPNVKNQNVFSKNIFSTLVMSNGFFFFNGDKSRLVDTLGKKV